MKAIVLTYAELNKEEEKLLKETDVFKIACNAHCPELKPNIRLCADNIVDKCLACDTCDVLSVDYDASVETDRVIRVATLPRLHSSLLYCTEWLILKGYDNILLVANNLFATGNTIKKSFQELNKQGINELKKCAYIYKYSKEGVFDMPTVSIEEFLNMEENTEFMPLTEEDKLLGRTTPRKKTILEKQALSEAYQYEICTIGLNNASIVGGNIIDSILSFENKQKLMSGVEEIECNGFRIKRITSCVIEEKKHEEKPVVVKKKKTRTK